MGDEMSSVAVPAPRVTIGRNPGAQLALALTVFALVLASNSIINDSWLNYSEESADDGSIDIDYGLTGFEIDYCESSVSSNCETIDETYSDVHDDDCDDSDSDVCADIKDLHNAGFIAKIFLIFSSVVLFAATILQVLSMLGKLRRVPNMISSIGGILVGTSVLVWYLMVPDNLALVNSEIDMGWDNMGQGFWLAVVASSAGLVAGFSGKIQSWIDGPPRMRAQGVRSGLEMNEFVLKESSCGNHSLSILADSELIRVVRINRIGASASINDVLATRRDSYTGFSHQRLDWLDDFKGLWWVVSGASLISTFMISSLFLIPLTIAALLVILQLMDPERFVVSTNSGDHPFYINRWRSNRELTNLSMDLVDDAMIAVLRGDELDTSALDARADLIAERFSAEQEFLRAKEQAKAEEKLALANSINQIPVEPIPQNTSIAMETQVIMQQPSPKIPMQPLAATEDLTTVHSAPATTEEEPVVIHEEPKVAENMSEENVTQHVPPFEEETPQEVVTIPPPPPLPTSAPPQNPPPGAREIPPPQEMSPYPTSPPPQNPPPGAMGMPPPPEMTPYPTSPPPQNPPPGAMGMPPPPGMTSMPPPPGMTGMPPPPGMTGMPPPPGVSPNPPPVIVQAAPREENLSDDEKDDLLGDLGA